MEMMFRINSHLRETNNQKEEENQNKRGEWANHHFMVLTQTD